MSDIKKEAKAQLEGRWSSIILLNFVPVILTIILSVVAWGGFSNGEWLLWSAETVREWRGVVEFFQMFFLVGISYSLLDIVRDKDYQINPLKDALQVFSAKYFMTVLIIHLLISLFTALWALLLIIPGLIKWYGCSQSFFIYKDLRDGPNEEFPSALDCMRESEKLMQGNRADLFTLHLSFIGWFFLEMLTFGIASLYVRPYYRMSTVVFYENLSAGYYKQAAEKNKPYSKERLEEEAF